MFGGGGGWPCEVLGVLDVARVQEPREEDVVLELAELDGLALDHVEGLLLAAAGDRERERGDGKHGQQPQEIRARGLQGRRESSKAGGPGGGTSGNARRVAVAPGDPDALGGGPALLELVAQAAQRGAEAAAGGAAAAE